MKICVCGKEFKTVSSLKTHQRACEVFHKDSKPVKCVCGREFQIPAKLSSHIKFCEVYCKLHNKEVRDPKKDKNNYKRAWNRGKTIDDPIYGESIKKFREGARKYRETHKEEVQAHMKYMSECRTAEHFKNQSESRKARYREGTLKPAIGVGKGDTCCLIYHDKEFWFRSSSELIYGLYLAYQNKQFDYENIHIEYENKTYFNDFYVDGKVVEIKGFATGKDIKEEEAFKSNGYEFVIIYDAEIQNIKSKLNTIFDVDSLLHQVHTSSKRRDYAKIEFSQLPNAGIVQR